MERDLYYLTPEKALEHARNGNLSTADAADRCDVKVRTFRRWLKLGLRDRPRRGVNTTLSFKIEAQIARTIEFYFFQGYSLSRARLKLSLAASTTRPWGQEQLTPRRGHQLSLECGFQGLLSVTISVNALQKRFLTTERLLLRQRTRNLCFKR